jgi:hypothetical protein
VWVGSSPSDDKRLQADSNFISVELTREIDQAFLISHVFTMIP